MTSGNFTTIFLDQIIIERGDRQRRTLSDIDSLAESIRNTGLINPPVIRRDFVLVAGERRITAMRQLGWLETPVQFTDELDPRALHLIELEENVKRLDLTWQEHNDAIARYHELLGKDNITETAAALNITPSAVSKHLSVHKIRTDEPELVANAETLSAAHNIATRRIERKKASAMADMMAAAPILTPEAKPGEPAAAAVETRRASIRNENFLEWASRPQPLFNLIHCDFPYGINAGDKIGQSGAKNFGTYADSPDIYFALLDTFLQKQDNFIHPSAHLLFWFSMKFYAETKLLLEGAGWRVDYLPLIWHKSDNAGIIPDAMRGGRNTYETAFFASRGDRKIVKPVAKSFATATTKTVHTSEKSYTMLQHFFRMVVDDTTNMLDPTCGSGMAVRVAEDMGAESALGLELNPDFAEAARAHLKL